MTEERVEHLLAEVQDEFGVIRVLEVADYRFLEFGDAIEQSCVFTADPSWLEYDYTRAMLIGALCHEQPESAWFLGLGACTLTKACPTNPRIKEGTMVRTDDLATPRGCLAGTCSELRGAGRHGAACLQTSRRVGAVPDAPVPCLLCSLPALPANASTSGSGS